MSSAYQMNVDDSDLLMDLKQAKDLLPSYLEHMTEGDSNFVGSVERVISILVKRHYGLETSFLKNLLHTVLGNVFQNFTHFLCGGTATIPILMHACEVLKLMLQRFSSNQSRYSTY